MSKHTCAELGVCQCRQDYAECHLPCSAPPVDLYPFAPGTLDGPHRPAPRWTLRRVLPLLAVLAALGSAAGYCATHLGWLA